MIARLDPRLRVSLRLLRAVLSLVTLFAASCGGESNAPPSEPPAPAIEQTSNELLLSATLLQPIVTGASHNCALLEGGAVKCWGANYAGQLGVGDTIARGDNPGELGDSVPTVSLGTGRTAKALAAGQSHT